MSKPLVREISEIEIIFWPNIMKSDSDESFKSNDLSSSSEDEMDGRSLDQIVADSKAKKPKLDSVSCNVDFSFNF